MLPSTLLCAPGARLFRIMSQVLVERLVVLVLQIGLWTGPKRLRLIQGLRRIARFQYDRDAQ